MLTQKGEEKCRICGRRRPVINLSKHLFWHKWKDWMASLSIRPPAHTCPRCPWPESPTRPGWPIAQAGRLSVLGGVVLEGGHWRLLKGVWRIFSWKLKKIWHTLVSEYFLESFNRKMLSFFGLIWIIFRSYKEETTKSNERNGKWERNRD